LNVSGVGCSGVDVLLGAGIANGVDVLPVVSTISGVTADVLAVSGSGVDVLAVSGSGVDVLAVAAGTAGGADVLLGVGTANGVEVLLAVGTAGGVYNTLDLLRVRCSGVVLLPIIGTASGASGVDVLPVGCTGLDDPDVASLKACGWSAGCVALVGQGVLPHTTTAPPMPALYATTAAQELHSVCDVARMHICGTLQDNAHRCVSVNRGVHGSKYPNLCIVSARPGVEKHTYPMQQACVPHTRCCP
jgi:hypothetical protein